MKQYQFGFKGGGHMSSFHRGAKHSAKAKKAAACATSKDGDFASGDK